MGGQAPAVAVPVDGESPSQSVVQMQWLLAQENDDDADDTAQILQQMELEGHDDDDDDELFQERR